MLTAIDKPVFNKGLLGRDQETVAAIHADRRLS